MPVTKAKWPRKLQILYGEVKDAEVELVEVSQTRSTGTGIGIGRTGRTGRGRLSGPHERDYEDLEGYRDYEERF